MTRHDLWHIAVLGSTLFGGAGLVIVLLGPLVLEERARPAEGVRRAVMGLLALASVLLLLEWLVIH
jgi:hypothetical protein